MTDERFDDSALLREPTPLMGAGQRGADMALVRFHVWVFTRLEIAGGCQMYSASATNAEATCNPAPFLQGGGACGALLRLMDWSRHPLGPPDQWPIMLQTTVSIILGSRQPMFVCWGPEYHTLYNDGYAVLCAKRHPKVLGRPFSEIWYDIWDVVEPMIDRVNAGESIQMDDITLLLHRNGYAEEAHFTFSYTPLRGEKNEVVGMFCACAETTEQVMLRREVDHERARLAEIFEQSPGFIAKTHGPEHVFEMVNPAFLQLTGHRDVIGKSVIEALPEIAGQGFIEMLDSVLATGETIRIDGAKVSLQRTPGSPLEDRFVDFVYQPTKDAAGKITGVIANGLDVTDRTCAQAALRTNERFLRSVIAASPDCIKVMDLAGRISFMNDGGRKIMEVSEDQVTDGLFWPDVWQEPAKTEVLASLENARQGAATRFQGYGDTFAGNRRYWDVRISPMLDANGQPDRILAISRDISYLRRVEEEREHLMHEASHRLKNAFGMVQSVINQTLRKARSLEEGHEVLSGRVRALANAQDILTRSNEGAMQIDAVVEAALLPHRTGEGRFVIDGPVAIISGRQSLGLSLALHELATNAIKYGALSGETGRVAIGWAIQSDGTFDFFWQESDGPAVTKPTRSGFGSVLIEKIVASYFDGSATLDFHHSGVVFRLTGSIAPPDQAEVINPYQHVPLPKQ